MNMSGYFSNVEMLSEKQIEKMTMLDLAFATGNAGLVRAERKIDGQVVYLICAIARKHERLRLVPLAELVGGQATGLYEPLDDAPVKEHVN